MSNLLKITAFFLLCAGFATAQNPATAPPAAAQTPATAPATAQPPATAPPAAAQTPATAPATAQPPATAPQAATANTIKKPMLEFANTSSAKIAWTSSQGADDVLQYSTDPNHFTQAVDAIEKLSGDNHRASLTGLQPNTTYYVRMTDKSGNPVAPVFSFKTPAQGQPAIHEQPLKQ